LVKYFGTDGIRGKVGVHPITPEFFLKLGWAAGTVLSRKGKASVIIGKDTRVSGYIFESALEAGFLSAGVDVGLLGPMPSPAIAYLTKAYNASAGVVISASHNPFYDNGIKFFSSEGFKLSDDDQDAIEELLNESEIKSVDSNILGKAVRHEQSIGRYVEFCKSNFNKKLSLSGLKIVVDCANGATYQMAQCIFSELGAQVQIINNQPDGYNINANCGATDTTSLQKEVIESNSDLGIAFDGDGDRLIMVDSHGNVVDGDQIVFIIAKKWMQDNRLTNNIVVGTKMTNLGIRLALSELGITFIEANVGDRYVMEQMQKYNGVLGGEGSGHIICADNTSSGDGIISALQILEVIASTGRTLDDLCQDFTIFPQTLINISLPENFDLDTHEILKTRVAEVEKKLDKTGRVLIRKSGTEPLLRIMVEGSDQLLVEESANYLAESIS